MAQVLFPEGSSRTSSSSSITVNLPDSACTQTSRSKIQNNDLQMRGKRPWIQRCSRSQVEGLARREGIALGQCFESAAQRR